MESWPSFWDDTVSSKFHSHTSINENREEGGRKSQKGNERYPVAAKNARGIIISQPLIVMLPKSKQHVTGFVFIFTTN